MTDNDNYKYIKMLSYNLTICYPSNIIIILVL